MNRLGLVTLFVVSKSAFAQTGPVMPVTRVVNGVMIREHSASAFARAPQLALDAKPLMVMGGLDGDPAYDLTWAQYVVPLRDGRIVTLSPVGNKLFVWGADGRPQRTIGRTGKGPGEWNAPAGMIALGGDTLFIPDDPNRRLNWVLPDKGVVIDTMAVETFSTRPGQLVGMLPGARMVFSDAHYIPWSAHDAGARSLALITVARVGGGPAREIARIPDMETVVRETRYGGTVRKEPYIVGLTAFARAIVWDTLVATSGDGYRIDLRNAMGRVVSAIHVGVARRPVTAAMRAARIAEELKRFDAPGGEGPVNTGRLAESKRLVREQAFADSLPSFALMFVTPGKTLWIVDAIAPTDTGWNATGFRLDGAIIGRLHGSGKGMPVAFGDDRVVVRTQDADGVVGMSVYRYR
jgi:hypothetical protein